MVAGAAVWCVAADSQTDSQDWTVSKALLFFEYTLSDVFQGGSKKKPKTTW